MGLSIKTSLNFIFAEALNNDLKGKSVLMLGKLAVFHNKIDLCAFAHKLGVKLKYDALQSDSLGGGGVDSYSFFKSLGFSEVHAMDISEYENADIIFDLNQQIPLELENKFDYIIDGGTTEHVFDYRQALFNIAKMLKVGGKVIHSIPGGGSSINHGYYTLSPSVLNDFYDSNGFQVEKLNIIMRKNILTKFKKQPLSSLTDCLLTMPDYRIFNFRDAEILPDYRGTLICIAKKIKQQDDIINPIQKQWYGVANIDLLREMWTTDLKLNQENIRIGVFGLGVTAQKFLNIIRECEGFKADKIKAFYRKFAAKAPSFSYGDEAAPKNVGTKILNML